MFGRHHVAALAAVTGALAIAAPAAQADTAAAPIPPSAVQSAWQAGAAAGLAGWQAGAAAGLQGMQVGAAAGLQGMQVGAAAGLAGWQAGMAAFAPGG